VYHITSRENASQEIFLDDKDSSSFLDILAQVIDRLGARSHIFILGVESTEIGTRRIVRGKPFLNWVIFVGSSGRTRTSNHSVNSRAAPL